MWALSTDPMFPIRNGDRDCQAFPNRIGEWESGSPEPSNLPSAAARRPGSIFTNATNRSSRRGRGYLIERKPPRFLYFHQIRLLQVA